MKIDSYNIGMESERHYRSFTGLRKYVSLDGSNSSTGSPLSSFTGLLGDSNTPYKNSEGDKTEPKNAEDVARQAMRELTSKAPANARAIVRIGDAQNKFQELHELMIRQIFELLFGKRIKDINSEGGPELRPVQYETYTKEEVTETMFYEKEELSFNARGIVRTSDGREINLNLDISMTREFKSFYTESVKTEMVRICDPLVVNLDDIPAGLSDMKFLFDLDCDGNEEEISHLNSGSGFLALDKNDDGIINDGSELFGAKSGDGFKDLAAYDSDNNGWIDENDDIFDKLKIWVHDANGNASLYTLKDKNIGAIYLGSADTQFSLNSHLDNSANGYVRKTGVFLYETGKAGSIQHIDLVS